MRFRRSRRARMPASGASSLPFERHVTSGVRDLPDGLTPEQAAICLRMLDGPGVSYAFKVPAPPVMTCDWCDAPMPHGPSAGCSTSTTVLYRGLFLGASLGLGGGGGVSGPASPSWKFCSKEHLDAWHAAGEPQQ
jgi:hypothetical protein